MGAVEPFPLIADLDGTPRSKEPVSAEFDGFLVEAEGCAFRGARGGLARGRGICPDHITLDGGERENRSVVVVKAGNISDAYGEGGAGQTKKKTDSQQLPVTRRKGHQKRRDGGGEHQRGENETTAEAVGEHAHGYACSEPRSTGTATSNAVCMADNAKRVRNRGANALISPQA